jgi:lysophospholipase L1-like esterase
MPRVQRYLFWLFAFCFLILGILLAPEISGHSMAEGDWDSTRSAWQYMRLVSSAAIATGILLAVTPVLPSKKTRRWLGAISYAASLLVIVELSSAVMVRLTLNNHTQDCRQYSFHPSLIAMPTPGYDANFRYGHRSHNSTGQRGPELGRDWWQARLRIAAVGGSTTYDFGVGDNDTWVHDLGKLLPPGVQIANFGVQGHSSAEHLTLTNFVLSDYRPDVILYFMGWNDLRSSHTPNLAGDYPYHQRSLYRSLLIDCPFSFTATGTVVKVITNRLYPNSVFNMVEAPQATEISADIDEHALAVYQRNIRLIAAAARTIGAEPIFVPQISNDAAAIGSQPHQWAPTIPRGAIPGFIHAYNDILIKTVRQEGAIVVPEVLNVPWSGADFMDFAHFSEIGTAKFAQALHGALADRLQQIEDRKAAALLPAQLKSNGGRS